LDSNTANISTTATISTAKEIELKMSAKTVEISSKGREVLPPLTNNISTTRHSKSVFKPAIAEVVKTLEIFSVYLAKDALEV
jgi:hypothetical protein